VEQQGNRVTVGDVSGRAGVTLAEAEDALQALAADSLGTLEVSTEGEVVYVFPRDFKNQIRSKSLMLRMEPRLKAMASTAAWLGRVAFGVFFIATVIAVWVAIIAIAASGDKDNNRSSRGSSRGGAVMFNLFDTLRFMSYMDARRSYDRYEEKDPNKMGFMESVFSFVFGDGDPNQEFEDLRWNTIGNYIRSHGGVVVAEELAPFLDLPKDAFEESMVVDEGYMLPVLTRFEGEPIVNDQGKLVYVFPKFQTTGISWLQRRGPSTAGYLKEQLWKFSKAGAGQLAMVVFFAVANVVGVGILSNLVFENMATGALVAPGLPYVLAVLQVYAWSFFVIPAVRWFINRARNNAIQERNRARADSLKNLSFQRQDLKLKLESARSMSKRKFVDRKDVVYSSAKDLEGQTTKWEEEDFDRRLNEIGQQ